MILPFQIPVTLCEYPVTVRNPAGAIQIHAGIISQVDTVRIGVIQSHRCFQILQNLIEPEAWQKRTELLSGGMQRRVALARALAVRSGLILMDEPFAGNDVFNREDFYKVLLGILEPHETLILSTHLIEEVTGFIGRAVLLHAGSVAGDVQTSALDEQGKSLMDYVKETYSYRADRVCKALADLTGGEDEHA